MSTLPCIHTCLCILLLLIADGMGFCSDDSVSSGGPEAEHGYDQSHAAELAAVRRKNLEKYGMS